MFVRFSMLRVPFWLASVPISRKSEATSFGPNIKYNYKTRYSTDTDSQPGGYADAERGIVVFKLAGSVCHICTVARFVVYLILGPNIMLNAYGPSFTR